MTGVKAFSFSGRFSVSVATPSATWYRSSSSIGNLPALALRQPQHALAQDVAEHLRGPGANAAGLGEELVVGPVAVGGRAGRPFQELTVEAQEPAPRLRQLLVELAPEELRGRPLRPRLAPAQDLGQAPVGVELEDLLAD